MISIPSSKTAPKAPNIARISNKDWLKGTVTAFDDGRTPIDGLRASGNVVLDQDGTIRPRPSLVRYGVTFPGTLLGELFEFEKTTGTANQYWLIGMFNVAGVTKPYTSQDGGTWTVANGKTFDNAASTRFCQVDNKVLILNGVDTLAYLNIPTLAVVPFTALAATSTPTLTTNTGLTGTNFSYWYSVSANSTVGETAASAALKVQVSTARFVWNPSTQSIQISWTAVPNATSYNIYLASQDPALGGTGYYLATVGSGSTTFTDNGSTVQDVGTSAPVADTTAGAKCSRGTVINGQVFLVGDKDNPRYVRYGGTGANVLDFSPFNGGGWTEIGRGTKEFPVSVKSFRDGKGNAQITVLCRGSNGTGKRYLLSPQTLTSGNTTISFFDQTEDNGQDGTDSPDGVIVYKDSLWYPSRDGFKTTGTKPQLQNILSTDTVSETIINDVRTLNNLSMANCVGLAYQNRLYWAVPNGSTTNNEIWVLDLQRGGAWMKPWTISAQWMSLYNSSDGLTHHLVVSNNTLYELTYAQSTNDDGVPFSTNITSGLIKFSEDGLDWAKVIDVSFTFLRPQGAISLTVAGKTEDSSLVAVGASTFTASTSVAGWGEAGYAGYGGGVVKPRIFGWSNFSVIPISYGVAQSLVTVEIDEICNYLSFEVDSSSTGVDFQLADVIVRHVPVGVLDLT